MKKSLVVICLIGLMLVGAAASAALKSEPLQFLDILADRSVNIFNYSFFDDAAEGKLVLYDLRNISDKGAFMCIDINTVSGVDQVLIKINGNGDKENRHLITAKLNNTKITILSATVAIETPLIITIYNGKMIISAAGTTQTVQKVDSFVGTLSTQSITGKLKLYLPDANIATGIN